MVLRGRRVFLLENALSCLCCSPLQSPPALSHSRMSQTLSPDLTSTFKETLESSPSPPKIRALLARSENNKLNLISTFNASSSDRDDFQPCLKQLLSQDKDRSGYVLFRLDTQSASGEWEWVSRPYKRGSKVGFRFALSTQARTRLALLNTSGSIPPDSFRFVWLINLMEQR